jgi:hypothetical protein
MIAVPVAKVVVSPKLLPQIITTLQGIVRHLEEQSS